METVLHQRKRYWITIMNGTCYHTLKKSFNCCRAFCVGLKELVLETVLLKVLQQKLGNKTGELFEVEET